jgi:tetratricopeptide (TPR) repeat protein
LLNDSGIALTEANRPAEAVPLFQKALDMEPENPLLWLNLGIARQRLGDYDEALASLGHALLLKDGLAEAWVAMGLIFYERGEFDLAEECYLSALIRDELSAKAWNNLGSLHFATCRYEAARHCFEEALSIAPLFYDAVYNLRDTCRHLNDYWAAAEFERVLAGLSKQSW